MKHTEASQQRLLIKHIRLDARTKHLVIASFPNGYHMSARQAAFAKAEGCLAGMPDLIVCVPNWDHPSLEERLPGCVSVNVYGALFLELKTAKGTVSAAQKAVHAELTKQGYLVRVVRSAEEGWNVLCEYLGVKP